MQGAGQSNPVQITAELAKVKLSLIEVGLYEGLVEDLFQLTDAVFASPVKGTSLYVLPDPFFSRE